MTYCPFEVGMHVVYLGGERRDIGEIFPRKGVVYTVRWVGVNHLGRVSIRLAEIINKKRNYKDGFMECVFLANHFRPLTRLTIDDFMTNLAPVDRQKVGA